jgi:peptidyl-prolyl cis-trans isomerase-like protein 2
VRLVTNFGSLNLELHCDQVTKTCDNFITLCKRGYYDGVKFHRLIKHFMAQSGDPTGTGRGGESIFGAPFEDEFCKLYSHEGRGILSMTNSGPNTNKSQFFITFRSCKHLDKKHTIFGRVVGGMEVLTKIEDVKTDEADKPTEAIIIEKTLIFVDPYKEAEEMIENERNKIETDKQASSRASIKEEKAKPFRQGIGAFINLDAVSKNLNSSNSEGNQKAKKLKSSFGNFDNW